MDNTEFARLLRYAADCINYCERIQKLPDCNNCYYSTRKCMYLPEWGADVRINCPHWKEEEPCGK